MNQTKRYWMVFAIVIVILLLVGNWWATPVHANKVKISTPIPTGTPFAQEDDPEIMDSRVPDKIKGVLQAYFALRYQALSVSPPEDFQVNGFGDLVSNGIEARDFLVTEMAKLAVEIKHAELNHLRYVNYKIFLDFRNITIDPDTQIVTVAVTAGNAVN